MNLDFALDNSTKISARVCRKKSPANKNKNNSPKYPYKTKLMKIGEKMKQKDNFLK